MLLERNSGKITNLLIHNSSLPSLPDPSEACDCAHDAQLLHWNAIYATSQFAPIAPEGLLIQVKGVKVPCDIPRHRASESEHVKRGLCDQLEGFEET